MGKNGVVFVCALFMVGFILMGCGQEGIRNDKSISQIEDADENILQVSLKMEQDDNSVNAVIENTEEYDELLRQLERMQMDGSLFQIELDMSGTDVCIYLDDILVHDNFHYITVKNGGFISVRNTRNSAGCMLESLELNHIIGLGESAAEFLARQGMLRIDIRIDDGYTGVMPVDRLLKNKSARFLSITWDDEEKGTGLPLEQIHKPVMEKLSTEFLITENIYLKDINQTNIDGNSYISYEFSEQESSDDIFAVIIEIMDKAGNAKQDSELISIPKERLKEINETKYWRFEIKDVNFDGYMDLLYLGYNNGMETGNYIGFLWDESIGGFAYCETMPKNFKYVDSEKKRLIQSEAESVFHDTYIIYEYKDDKYHKKCLSVDMPRSGEDRVTFLYYEDDKLISSLDMSGNGDGKFYIYMDEDGKVVEGKLQEGADYQNLGKEFYPEFDFYNNG